MLMTLRNPGNHRTKMERLEKGKYRYVCRSYKEY